MKLYTARAVRSGKWWAVTIDGVKGAHSQAKRLDQVESNAREVIALMTDQEADSFDVQVIHELPTEWRNVLEHYLKLSDEASERQQRLSEAQDVTVAQLIDSGLSMRDVGSLMGISFQRVAQVKARETADSQS
jgi:predicted RNase H-like HicB family nuclease